MAQLFVDKFGCEIERTPNQSGNYRETKRENNDALDRLEWKPTDTLKQYIDNL